MPNPSTQSHWVGLPRGVIPSIDILYISDPKVMARLSQSHKKQDGRPKMLNGQQTTETAIIFEYFSSQSYFSAYILQVYMKPDNINCFSVNYFTVLYVSSKYKKIFQLFEN